MPATVVIPARYGSTRFPAKILAAETGRPLVQHVVDRVRHCKRVDTILVATDDQRIVDALTPFGTRCVMTSTEHPSGTDRIAEVARRGLTGDLIVNVQGDEPEIEPETIDGLVAHMESSGDDMATVATPLESSKAADPNLVKVIRSLSGHAIYFSRSPVPFYRDSAGGVGQKSFGEEGGGYLLHLGMYAYRKEYLLRFAGWAPTPLELAEKLEQLRALEHGSKMYVMRVSRASHGIDTPEQYQAFVQRTRPPPSSPPARSPVAVGSVVVEGGGPKGH